jgi:hypothetical protein
MLFRWLEGYFLRWNSFFLITLLPDQTRQIKLTNMTFEIRCLMNYRSALGVALAGVM